MPCKCVVVSKQQCIAIQQCCVLVVREFITHVFMRTHEDFFVSTLRHCCLCCGFVVCLLYVDEMWVLALTPTPTAYFLHE